MENEKSSFQIQGHRGARGLYPENTLPAFEYALELGADVLEFDLGVTRDGVLVVSHDPFLNPEICLDPGGNVITEPVLIHSLTLDELKRYDCGTRQNPLFSRQTPVPGTRIPTLEEVFTLVRNSPHPHARHVEFNIETKIFPDAPELTVSPEVFSEKVVTAFQQSGFLARITLQSFDIRTLILAKKIEPSIRTVMLIDHSEMNWTELGKKADAETLSMNYLSLTADLVHLCQNAGFRVIPWTVNKPKDWEKMIQFGVDGIITDYPAELKQYRDDSFKPRSPRTSAFPW